MQDNLLYVMITDIGLYQTINQLKTRNKLLHTDQQPTTIHGRNVLPASACI